MIICVPNGRPEQALAQCGRRRAHQPWLQDLNGTPPRPRSMMLTLLTMVLMGPAFDAEPPGRSPAGARRSNPRRRLHPQTRAATPSATSHPQAASAMRRLCHAADWADCTAVGMSALVLAGAERADPGRGRGAGSASATPDRARNPCVFWVVWQWWLKRKRSSVSPRGPPARNHLGLGCQRDVHPFAHRSVQHPPKATHRYEEYYQASPEAAGGACRHVLGTSCTVHTHSLRPSHHYLHRSPHRMWGDQPAMNRSLLEAGMGTHGPVGQRHATKEERVRMSYVHAQALVPLNLCVRGRRAEA